MSGGFVPLIPFLISQTSHLIYSIMLSIIFLFAIGAYGAKTIGNDIIVTGARTAAIGLVAALITYYVGICFSMLAPLYG
ncbi:MAG: VIT1/CCC1 transporter family protein [Candidatus Nanoarchaeia archaeon]